MATTSTVAIGIALAVCALTALLAVAEIEYVSLEPTPIELKPIELATHRLPTNVRPLHYDLEIDFIMGVMTRYQWEEYTGKVRIEVEFSGPSKGKVRRCINKLTHVFAGLGQTDKCLRAGRSNRIVMHSDRTLKLYSVQVSRIVDGTGLSAGLSEFKKLKIKSLTADEQKQLIAIDLASELPTDGSRGLIEFTFAGSSRNDNTGIYQSDSTVRGKSYSQVAAKFQPTFARWSLPCFDEPAYKATFSLAIKHPIKYQAYATTELISREILPTKGERKNVVSKFKKTPRMSIHMFAFTVAEFDEPLEMQVRDNLRLRAITPMHRREAAAYALEVAKFSIEWFEKYIGYEFPLEKLDIVAFPDTDTDNTETWGLVFVRDILALVDDETKPDTRITTAVNVAHVVVHQWFANLITAEWWDDMWITESVAAQMAFEIVAELFPEQSEYFVRISTLSGVITSDSSGKNHSLSPPESDLSTYKQVYELFDNIQFMKSGALARMQQDTLGREGFRKVLQNLVRHHAYSNVDFGDLMKAISESTNSGLPMEEILSSWSKLKSYPIINVGFNQAEKKLILYEEPRPLANSNYVDLSSANFQNKWVLPLKVLISDASTERQVTKELILGDHISQSFIDLPAWFDVSRDFVKVSPNPSLATYYRVRYSDELLQPLKAPVEQKKLPTMDRLHLLDDSRALAAGSLVKPDTFKELLGWHASETEAAMIIEMLLSTQTLSTLKTTDATPSPASQVFMDLYRNYGFRVSGEETLLMQRARMVTLTALINRRVQEVIEAGVKAFDESNGLVALFLREPVYAAVVAAGTDAQVKQMLEHLIGSDSHEEQLRLANALSVYTRNMDILDDLGRWLVGSDLKPIEKDQVYEKMVKSRKEISDRKKAGQ